MIAGVWAPSGVQQADRVLSRISRAAGGPPNAIVTGKHFGLASWSLGTVGRIDAERNLGWVGSLRANPDLDDLGGLSCTPGEYALIAAKAEGLVLARGRHAGRVLYGAQLPDGAVAACSRLAPLVACLERSTPNTRALAALITRKLPEPPSATPFREIRRVEASQTLLFGSAGVILARHAQPSFGEVRGSPDELAEELRATLDRAIRRSINGMRRVSVLVSGGLDSSSVLAHTVAITRGANRTEVDAITVSFASPGDDRPHLNALCNALGIVPLLISPSDASKNVIPALIADAAPIIWPTAGWNLTTGERARQNGSDALLTGQGGDQLFAGDQRTLRRHAWSGHWPDAIGRAYGLLRHQSVGSMFGLAKLVLAPPAVSNFPFVRRLQSARQRRYFARRWPWAGPRLRDAILDISSEGPRNDDWQHPTNAPRVQRLIRRDFLQIAETRGQIEAATGMTRLDPLIDDEVVSLVASFPQEEMFFDGRSRGLFRHAMKRSVPESLRLRPDKAKPESGIAEMVRGSDIKALRDLASMHMLGDLGLVEPLRYRRHFDAVLSAGPMSRDWIGIWPALAVEAFVRSQWGTLDKEQPWRASA